MNPNKSVAALAGRLLSAGCLAFLALAFILAAWAVLERPVHAPEWSGRLKGVTYSGYRPGQGPQQGKYPSEQEVRDDLAQLANVTARIRTYTASEGPEVSRLAADYGLDVTLGSWVVGDLERDEQELQALIRQARTNSSVSRVLVGNESLLRGDLTSAQLSAYLQRVRRATGKPVSTAEPWNMWLKYPEVAQHVDFIAAHVLPYWEQLPVEEALAQALERIERLRKAFPGKPIVVAETGWPSHGDAWGVAQPSPKNQSRYLREFAAKARELNIDYYVMQAYDEEWKRASEGRVGMYWGIFGADRSLKLQGTGIVWGDPGFATWAPKALAWMFLPVALVCLGLGRMRALARLALACALFAAGGYLVWYSRAFDGLYGISAPVVAGLMLPLTALCLLVLLVQLFEATEVLGLRTWRRGFGLRPVSAGKPQPFVSLHLACANEPPEMVIATLESFAQLRYENFEVLVVDNNTKDEGLWKPVQAWVEQHSEKFRFWHLPSCPGFKAEALNHALAHTSAHAEVVGVVDADYVVDPGWLEQLVGHFEEEKVAIVQSPQAHREIEHDRLARWASYEFDGFFRIGMHHRNERNAIIQHGTMTLVRARVLRDVGGWATWTICEDAELGLRIMAAGYETRYVDHVMGRGLAPATFAAFRSQRRRWALGAMQILKGHWRELVGPSGLTLGQRYHFLTGWLPWVSEALQLVGVVLALGWTAGMLVAPQVFEPPMPAVLALVFAVPVVRLVLGLVLFRARVKCSWGDTLGAALASMAVIYATAEGVLTGLLGKHAKFIVTAKVKSRSAPNPLTVVRRERWLAGLLLTAAALTLVSYGLGQPEPLAWAFALALLALPYAATVAMVALTAPGCLRPARSTDVAPAPVVRTPEKPAAS
ncbi:Cellulose synthase catalytic subunit [UDP-forming] [compost metagenome]